MRRVLILSWEYPPLIEGGLARHVLKLAENLADQGVDVHVLARGREEDPAEQETHSASARGDRRPDRERLRALRSLGEAGGDHRQRFDSFFF